MNSTNELIDALDYIIETYAIEEQEEIIKQARNKLFCFAEYYYRAQLTEEEIKTILKIAEDIAVMEFPTEYEKLYELAMLEYSLQEYNRAMEQQIIIDRDEWILWFLNENMETAYVICERALKVGRRPLNEEVQTLDEYFQLAQYLPMNLTDGNTDSDKELYNGQMDGRIRVVWM